MLLPVQYAWFEPVLVATIVVFIIDLIGSSPRFYWGNDTSQHKCRCFATETSLVDLAQCVGYRTDMDCRLFVMLNPVIDI
jgi:hypothetical protein